MKPLPSTIGAGERPQRQSDKRQVLERVAHPAALLAPLHQHAADIAHGDARERSEEHLLGGEDRPIGGALAAFGRPEAGEQDHHRRQGDAVVEPALDVQGLADAHRHAPVADHGLAEGGVGGRIVSWINGSSFARLGTSSQSGTTPP
jgi:hypothetical protein